MAKRLRTKEGGYEVKIAPSVETEKELKKIKKK
mgnify:CR=1 FL=1